MNKSFFLEKLSEYAILNMGDNMDIVIIGAGPAGLSCAYYLLKSKKNIKVTILEEASSVGGISKTINHNGNRMDIGGHRFFSKDDRVMKFWSELMPVQRKKFI